MSDTPSNVDRPEMEMPDMAAAELALGLLDGDDRALATRRVLAEPGFAREVERWRSHLAQLFDLWPSVPAHDALFARIERSLDRPAAPAADAPRRGATGWLWQGLAGLSSVAAAALLVILVTRPVPVPPAPRAASPVAAAPAPVLVASIDPDRAAMKAAVPVTAVYDPVRGALRLTEAALADADRSAELWVIPADGVPHSLGLLHSRGVTALTLSAENRARFVAGVTLAVTLEPIGGSPTGLPTGPVVAKGALSQV